MSDFGGLSIGLSGLQAHRRALDVTGHNLANVNTPGYSRQRVDLSPITNPTTANIFARSNDAGTGVRAGTAYRLHDQFVEMRALQEHGTDGALKQSQAVLSQIEMAVNEPSDTGLASQINRFMAAWDDVANRPDDLSARQQLVELGKTLAADFAQLDGSLAALSQNTGRELEATVSDINSAAAAVADLNNRVLAAVNADMPAGDLMDQRDVMIRNLADLAGVTVRPQANGVVDVYLGTTALVRGNRPEALRVDVTTTPGTTAVVWDRLGVNAAAGYISKPVYGYPLFQNHNFFAGAWPLRDAGLTTMDYRTVKCPVAETMLAEGVSLPISPALTDEIIDQTADALAKVSRHFAK